MCDDDADIGIGNWAYIIYAITITSGLKSIVAVGGGLSSPFPTTTTVPFGSSAPSPLLSRTSTPLRPLDL
ncbi:hypothetical protein N7516_000555 [Penicillium verrucosum]|uniref:uncharacterized protein n=1 Tax=Penicillium verrucosum TaxID=60171 RepID=UPI002545061C|nr:uncharacterized protein N7516_000555 [Penicillium verrucosum]KAJ5940387.1 hypothetical protein N7516_000555 [Penicillium verrucosum]